VILAGGCLGEGELGRGREAEAGREKGRWREREGTCAILSLCSFGHLNASNAYIKGRREYNASL
jgi:hypothetical protein